MEPQNYCVQVCFAEDPIPLHTNHPEVQTRPQTVYLSGTCIALMVDEHSQMSNFLTIASTIGVVVYCRYSLNCLSIGSKFMVMKTLPEKKRQKVKVPRKACMIVSSMLKRKLRPQRLAVAR